jgi:Sulfotransferase domain
MSFPPEIYLIGAQKAGTTTLAYLLAQHPHITVSQAKEPHFFTDRWDRGLEWYKKQFPDPPDATICMDASTSYSMAPLTGGWKRRNPKVYENVPARVSSVSPNAKFIYILRDPVDRTYSGYWHDVRMGMEKEEFRSALAIDPFYLDVSNYYGQLLRWLDYFSPRSFFFVLFEDLKEDPERALRGCHEFLGVNGINASIGLHSAQNQSYQVGWVGRKMNKLAVTHPGLRTALRSVVPGSVRRLVSSVKGGSVTVPAMKDEDETFLVEYFRETNHNLERLIGTSLGRWRR